MPVHTITIPAVELPRRVREELEAAHQRQHGDRGGWEDGELVVTVECSETDPEKVKQTLLKRLQRS